MNINPIPESSNPAEPTKLITPNPYTNSAHPRTRRFLYAFVILNIILNYFWRHQLFKLGLNMIHRFQQQKHITLDVFFYVFTLMIDPAVVLVTTFTLIVVVRNKYRAFVTVMFILLNTYFAGLLKAFYADPRPFWAHKAIQSIGFYCPQEYGNPSGHSWFSVLIGFAVIVEFWGLGKRFQYFCTALALIVFVPMSRMYLGAHSLNQVMQGLSLGFTMIFFFKFCGLKQQIESYLKNFNAEKSQKWVKFVVLLHILYIFSFMINEDDINPYHKPISETWIKNIKNKCSKNVDTNHLNFMMLMINSLLVNASTGIGIGFKNIYNTKEGRLFLCGKWKVNTREHGVLLGHLKYYFVEVTHLMCGLVPVVALVYFFGPKHWMMFVFGNLGALISGYVYTSNTYKKLFQHKIIIEKLEESHSEGEGKCVKDN